MKRVSKKLQLNKETIAILDDSQQKAIQGGYDDSITLIPTLDTLLITNQTCGIDCNTF